MAASGRRRRRGHSSRECLYVCVCLNADLCVVVVVVSSNLLSCSVDERGVAESTGDRQNCGVVVLFGVSISPGLCVGFCGRRVLAFALYR